jgi:hypothetical protein
MLLSGISASIFETCDPLAAKLIGAARQGIDAESPNAQRVENRRGISMLASSD